MRARGGFISCACSWCYLRESLERLSRFDQLCVLSAFPSLSATTARRIFNAYRSGMSPSSSPLPVDSLASPSTRAEPLTPEELAALCNTQAVQLELYRSAALTAEAELMVLRLALGAADGDCACLQEAWLIAAERSAIAEANLSARAALPSTIAEPTAQGAEPNLGSQLRQMEQLADACGRQASMQRREQRREQ